MKIMVTTNASSITIGKKEIKVMCISVLMMVKCMKGRMVQQYWSLTAMRTTVKLRKKHLLLTKIGIVQIQQLIPQQMMFILIKIKVDALM